MTRARALLTALAIGLALVAGSRPRIVGDGGEYLAMALDLASLHGPAIEPDRMALIRSQVGATSPYMADWDMPDAGVRDARGRLDFLHFWFYSLLAVPGVCAARAVGASPLVGFTALNLVLLAAAFWIALPRLGGALCLLLFAGPIVWWIDKAHTEAFTFSLLLMTWVLVREKPWWALLFAGMASTQNPPIAVVAVLIGAIQLPRGRALLGDARLLAGATAGAALVLLQPLYELARHGTPSLLLATVNSGVPGWAEFSAVAFDPEVGLVANFPAFAIVAAAAIGVILARRRREMASLDIVIAGLTGLVFLYTFGRVSNVHHGATPSLSRYGIWLVPLAVPFLVRARALGGRPWAAGVWAAAVASSIACAFVFHPGIGQNSREPTWLAHYLWTAHPNWNNPLPEVFGETLRHQESRWVPVATDGCEKILFIGRGGNGGWPIPCVPADVPPECAGPGVLCYANLVGGRYEFVLAPGKWNGDYRLERDAVWPPDVEPVVKRLLDGWASWRLRVDPAGADILRAVDDVHASALASADGRQFVFVLRGLGAHPSVTFRSTAPLDGEFFDAGTGASLQHVHFDGGTGVWPVNVPTGSDLLLLTVRIGKS